MDYAFQRLYVELKDLKLISENNPDIGKYTLGNAKKNNKLTAPSIQKEIIECFAKEVTKMISEEIKDNVFGLLVDESSDVSLKEQMAVVVRYIDKHGVVKESFIGIAHVKDTSTSTLKQAIVYLLASNQLSTDQVRGQGYDGASNMRREFNGLKALILKDNLSTYYIHCFAHQLQLVIVAVAKKHTGVKTFYEYLAMIVNTVSASCKRKDMIREAKKERVEKEIEKGEIKIGKGLNQEVSLVRAGDTRWGSHHRTIISLLRLFLEVVDVLRYIKKEGDVTQQRSNEKEYGNRFNEVTATLQENMSGLNPCDRFSKFDTSKIIAFSEMYENDFTTKERGCLLGELNALYHSVKKDLIKTDVRNRMGDDYLNNALVCAVERETFDKVTEDNVMARFQAIKCQRGEIIY
ncbi:uncharacterized protein LOC143628038 [Bidens hawaiensis]|uniref:uncharacterized protein LOC143628038 n=1 Tax=Bidens hawaiensis TaxID=980011 RepID=UPI0040497E1C